MVACVLRLPPAASGSGVRCGRACWGLGFGCAPPLVGGVLGCVCARAPVPRGPLHLLVGGAVRGCVFVRVPRLFPAFPGWGALCVRACWARVWAVPRPFLLGCRGVFFELFLKGGVSLFGFVVSVAGCPCLPIPFLSGSVAGSFLFQRGVCLHVTVSLFLLGRCSWFGVAGFGWVVSLCLFRGSVFGAFLVGGLAASCGVGGRFGGCGLFPRPPPLPPLFSLSGGGSACSSLCLPWAGARTGPLLCCCQYFGWYAVVFAAQWSACPAVGCVGPKWPFRVDSSCPSCVGPVWYVLTARCPLRGGRVLRGRKVATIGTTAEKRFEIRYHMPCLALEASLHAQLIIWYFAVPFRCPLKSFIVFSALCFCCASPAACCWCRVLLLVFDGENVSLLKYNQSRITQARDKQVEDKQDQTMKGCSHKELDKGNLQQ